MKRIKHYDGNSQEFHDEVVGNKRHHPTDPGYKSRIRNLKSISETRFREYDGKFETNKLQEIVEIDYSNRQKTDFQSLYKFDVEPFPKLYIELSKDERGRKYPYCPLCDMEGTSSFDHILPQSKFPEFSDHPLNLVRSCQLCNGKKSANWKEGDRRRYLDLYIDEIPDVQFLFVKVDVDDGDGSLTVQFTIDNRNGIDADLFRMIHNHFDDLEICTRYNNGASEVISTLQDDIVANLDLGASKEDIKSSVITKCNREQLRNGINYWRAILKKACVEDEKIFDYIINKSAAGVDL